jgi:hypothetical protein
VKFSRQRSNALNSISHVSRTGSLLRPTSSIISVQIIPRVPERLQATVLQLDLDPIGAPAFLVLKPAFLPQQACCALSTEYLPTSTRERDVFPGYVALMTGDLA